MKNTLLFFACLFMTQALLAQSPRKEDLAPCGTVSELDPHTVEFLRAHPAASPRMDDTLWVGLQIHLVGRDDGSGRFQPNKLLEAFCRINTDFADSKIQYFFKYDWNYIDSTAWHAFDTITVGRDMMFANDVPDATNCYFVNDPSGTCGFNLPYASVAMAFACSGPNDHTWTHELGHQYGVAHPFIGWENTVYDPNGTTPDTVYYDYTHFHATPDSVNAPLDTALVEYADGSNCAIAGDLLCDTDADYFGALRWIGCNDDGRSNALLKDPLGNTFRADGTLFMCYAADDCQNRFSDQQIAIMRDHLQNIKPFVLSSTPPATPLAALPELESPINGNDQPNLGGQLKWKSVEGASGYIVQVSRFSSFFAIEVNELVTDTTFTVDQLVPGFDHYWRVKPFNAVDGCSNFSEVGTFKTVAAVSAIEQNEQTLRLYPSISRAGDPLWLESGSGTGLTDADLRIFDALGRMVIQQRLTTGTDRSRLDLNGACDAPGVYRMVLQSRTGNQVFTFVRQ